MTYQPKTGQRCTCKRGIQRRNCPACEGTGWRIDFRAIRERAGKVTAYDIAAKLAKMERGDNIAEFGPRILELMKGVPWNVWQELDEKPGKFGYMDDRFYMLRQVRNHPDWGRKMFDGFRKDNPLGLRR